MKMKKAKLVKGEYLIINENGTQNICSFHKIKTLKYYVSNMQKLKISKIELFKEFL